MDYVYQISILQQKKKEIVLDSLSSYLSSYKTYFHQGSNLMTNTEPFMSGLQGNLKKMRDKTAQLEKQLEKRHTLVTQAESLDTARPPEAAPDLKSGVEIEGYLFKRSQKAFRTWKRRWFYLCNNKVGIHSPFILHS